MADWWRDLDGLSGATRSATTSPTTASLSPQYVIKRIGEITGPEANYVAGVGQHQMWAAQFVRYERPGSWLNSGGLGTMGYCRARRDGRQGRPSRTATSGRIDGDGCFQMTNQELATCASRTSRSRSR